MNLKTVRFLTLTSLVATSMACFSGVSLAQGNNSEKDVQVIISKNTNGTLSTDAIAKIKAQLEPTATSVTINEIAPTVVPSKKRVRRFVGCFEGASFDGNLVSSYVFVKGDEGSHYINKTGSDITFTSTFSHSFTKSGELSGEAKWGWGPVEAKAGFKISGSITTSTSEASTVTVRPHYEGWNDYGTLNDTWYGKYYYLNTDCSETGVTYLTATGPRVKATIANERYVTF